MVNTRRLVDRFLRYVACDSESGNERRFCLLIEEELRALGMEVSRDTGVLHAGMVISDEPGVYIAGSHGLRIENQLLCCPAEHEGFLQFDILTLAPIDLDAVDLQWLDAAGRANLNRYHQRVYDTLSHLLPDDVRTWLRQATREI